jgi:hypothetical protein
VQNQARAGAFAVASLGDLVWHDIDADGHQDPSEPGVAGVTVQLYDAAASLLATTATDANGGYQFVGLEPGTYRVRVIGPTGWVISQSNAAPDDRDSDVDATGRTQLITLASGSVALDWDAGLFQPPAPEPDPQPDPEPAPQPNPNPNPNPNPVPTVPLAPPPAGDPGSVGGGALPRTGTDLRKLLQMSIACVALGCLVDLATRRRRRHATG